MTDFESVANRLLSPETFDVAALDQVVQATYDPVSPHRAASNKVLMQLQEMPDLWVKADAIIENAQHAQTRFFGLQTLDEAIKTRYVVLHAIYKIDDYVRRSHDRIGIGKSSRQAMVLLFHTSCVCVCVCVCVVLS